MAAIRADAEHLKPVPGDLEVGARAERFKHRGDRAFVELDNRATVRADQVMSVRAVTFDAHVVVAAVGAVQPVEQTATHKNIQRAEDRRTSDGLTEPCKAAQQFVGSEGT